MLICDKPLSSSLENGYVLSQIMEEFITFALLIDVINLQAIHNDFFYLWAKGIISLANSNKKVCQSHN